MALPISGNGIAPSLILNAPLHILHEHSLRSCSQSCLLRICNSLLRRLRSSLHLQPTLNATVYPAANSPNSLASGF